MDFPHPLGAQPVAVCPSTHLSRASERLYRSARTSLISSGIAITIILAHAALAAAQDQPAESAPLPAPVEAVPSAPAEAAQPPQAPQPAALEAAAPATQPQSTEPGTVLAEADAALANPALGEDARHIVELFRLVNQARAEHGLYPLKMDARLVASAQAHASNMAHAHYCRHTGLDGSSAKARIRANGYAHNNWAGENIICSRWTAQDAMAWWLNSGPHRRNILHGHFTHIGVGYDPAGQYGPSWVLNFAAGAPDTIGVSYMPASGSTMP